jgi:mannose-6-phosphate isomerase class I
MDAFISNEKLEGIRNDIRDNQDGIILVIGAGASLIEPDPDILVYADMARWEIQKRMRKNEVSNIGVSNADESFEAKYKRGYFVDWRVCDRLKKKLADRWDYVLDTNRKGQPVMITAALFERAMNHAITRPFSVVPYFDPGPWGGQWMKEVCNLDKKAENFAWCFNCVPEENSMYFNFDGVRFETPAINLVFFQPVNLLGNPVHARFGDEFPIRFDFLDTMEGGNLSLQVHPLTEYIQEKFGVHYTQDESYYLLDAKDNASVYLGFREDAKKDKMIPELLASEKEGRSFDAEKYVEKWPAKKHDHFLIPGGTIHCSGKDSMVLEISSTPYIFTFKLWDWERVGLDGKPRPINIEHGLNNLQWDRRSSWTKKNLVNRVEKIAEGNGWVEEKTGLHEREFIETRRHWFTKKVTHHTNSSVNVLNLVEGEEVIVESPLGNFEPFVVHYAETFIVPASVGEYTISPFGRSEGQRCGTIKAYVRT